MADSANQNKGCLTILLPILEKFNLTLKTEQNKKEPLPYRVRDDFLSPAELSFYQVLKNLLGSRMVIQSKVRLADIFFVSQPQKYRTFFAKISQKHLDFLVCEAETMQPVFGVELDDSSHDTPSRKKRDRFVDEVFATAKLPLLHFRVKRSYNVSEIVEKVRPIIQNYLKTGTGSQPKPANQPNQSNQAASVTVVKEENIPLCPKCGIPMVKRTVSKGVNIGKQFYGCVNFPKCREVRPIESSDA